MKLMRTEDVLEGYRMTGAEPARCVLFNGREMCGLGALYCYEQGLTEVPDYDTRGYSYLEEIYGEDAVNVFCCTFDGIDPYAEALDIEEEVERYEDGLRSNWAKEFSSEQLERMSSARRAAMETRLALSGAAKPEAVLAGA